MKALAAGMLTLALGILALEFFGAQSQPAIQCFLPQEKDRLIELSHAAIDDAFKAHVQALFDVWVRDPAEQPKRAMSGMAINLSAYHRARANIRNWEPTICN